jgi:hypothetical protein
MGETEEGNDPLSGIRGPDGDAIAVLHAGRHESPGKGVSGFLKLSEAQTGIAVDDGRLIAEANGRRCDQCGNGHALTPISAGPLIRRARSVLMIFCQSKSHLRRARLPGGYSR